VAQIYLGFFNSWPDTSIHCKTSLWGYIVWCACLLPSVNCTQCTYARRDGQAE